MPLRQHTTISRYIGARSTHQHVLPARNGRPMLRRPSFEIQNGGLYTQYWVLAVFYSQ